MQRAEISNICYLLFCGIAIVMTVGCQPWQCLAPRPDGPSFGFGHFCICWLPGGTAAEEERCIDEELLRNFSIFRRPLMRRSLRQTHSLLEPISLACLWMWEAPARESKLLVNGTSGSSGQLRLQPEPTAHPPRVISIIK